MMEELLGYLRNWFVTEVTEGTFEVTGGVIAPVSLEEGDFIRIDGSGRRDGVYLIGTDAPEDGTFTGEIWRLGIPKALRELCAEIEAWERENGASCASPYTSESFGGYSYQRNSETSGWKDVFKSRLEPWRKI